MTRHAFQTHGHFHQFAKARVGLERGAQLRGLLERIFERDVELVGNELGEAIHVAVRQIHGAADVLDGGLGGHGAEGDDLGDVRAAVFLGDVFDHFAAAPHAEVDVDVGHRHALGIEKALEEQIVFERIDVGDAQRVADQAAGRRAASRAHGNALGARVADEIPDDQEVTLSSASARSS